MFKEKAIQGENYANAVPRLNRIFAEIAEKISGSSVTGHNGTVKVSDAEGTEKKLTFKDGVLTKVSG